MPPRRSPLHDWHRATGAKMAPFGGWEMPLEFPGGGVVKEHTAVREAVGIFDVSHLGKARVTGPGATAYVNTALTNDLDRITAGQAQYTLCCADDGGVVDDLIAYRRGDDEVFLVPNAANAGEVVRLLSSSAPDGVDVHDAHEEYGVLAVQGPRSDDMLDALGLPHGHPYMSWVDATWQGRPVVVCRTGYTGERGYELLPRWDDTAALWQAALAAGAASGLVPAGLGARDTLRTEMGYPLHGQDLGTDITPVQARLGWAVGWRKASGFRGRDALVAERTAGPRRLLWGLRAVGRGIPRPGMPVLRAEADGPEAGAEVGRVTSGTFSPTLGRGIALALLDTSAGLGEGDTVAVDVRGRAVPVEVVKPPFVPAAARSA